MSVDDNVAPELAFTLARAMINEINGSAKDASMDALNQMSKSDEGINTIIEATPKIKAEAKAEGKCVSYNLGRMKSQAHEAGNARCTNDRAKLRKGGIQLADACPKCSKGTSQLVKSLEAADK